MSQDKVILELRKLKKYFPLKKNVNLKAVEDVTFKIYEGEKFGVVGESGCGKSTLGRVILQLYKQTSGSCVYYGKTIEEVNPKYIAKEIAKLVKYQQEADKYYKQALEVDKKIEACYAQRDAYDVDGSKSDIKKYDNLSLKIGKLEFESKELKKNASRQLREGSRTVGSLILCKDLPKIAELFAKAQKEVENMMREEGEAATLEVGIHGIHPELVRLLGKLKFRTSYGQNALKHSVEVAQLCGLLAGEIGVDIKVAKRAGLLHDIGKSLDHEMEGSHVQIGADLCRKYKESALVVNAVESHHGDVEPESLIALLVQAADTISAARPGARRETLETYTTRLKKLEDIANSHKGVDKTFAIQAGREIRVMVVPEHVSDSDMVLLARDIAKQIEDELEYPGQIKVNIIRESRVTDYAK